MPRHYEASQSMKSLLALLLAVGSMRAEDLPGSYKVIWDNPSQDSLESMPLSGRHGAGANVWVRDGSIWLYLAHSGAFDEQGRLLKLGCIRITPLGFKLGESGFRQELDPATGKITITQNGFKASLWFVGGNLVFVSTSASSDARDVALRSWRDKKRDGLNLDIFGQHHVGDDCIKADQDGFVWFNRDADFGLDVVDMAKGHGIEQSAMTATASAKDLNWPAKVTAHGIVFERDADEDSANVKFTSLSHLVENINSSCHHSGRGC